MTDQPDTEAVRVARLEAVAADQTLRTSREW